MASKIANWWRQSLKKRPVITNTVVYATFYTAAELSQQTFNKIYSPEKPDIDLKSAGRIVAVGSCLYAPTLYYWYKFLDKKFVGTAVKVVATKVVAEQFIMTPTLLAAFYTLLGVLERREDVLEELRDKYWKTFLANQAFWIPGQTINFFFVPSNLRVVYVASASFIWINVLCFIKRQKVEKVGENQEKLRNN
ncbi:mpv17-like protein [Pararge aegeria]|uniref:Jg19628 protein n=1 Tax=Pararge aegeria aegeria TaxID=348720 RepID=A0A8S4SB72_9NEOP|nr:mpv17-like protein [Pararge aegeria]CAH2256668.1 jg19628 [Pararge aegeria aegeria]